MRMPKTSRQTKGFSIRVLIIVALLVMLVLSLATLTYAWYRNYVDIEGTHVTTGKITFLIESYSVDQEGNVSDPEEWSFDGETENSVVVESDVKKISSWNNLPHHVYYFIKNPLTETSIDLDASLAISLENAQIPEEIGGIRVSVTQVSNGEIESSLSSVTPATVKERISASLSSINASEGSVSFSNLQNAYEEFSVKKGEYVCIRISYVLPANLASYSNLDLGIRVSFCLAQKGGLPDANDVSEYVVYSTEAFQTALGQYRPNDKIIVKGNVNYVGDVVLNRPLSLAVQNSTLTVMGNFIYAYPYQGHFTIDTSSGGKIVVLKSTVEVVDSAGNVVDHVSVGGNVELAIPQAQLEFIGKNISDVTRGDLYVQGEMSVTASKTSAGSSTDNGFIVNGARMYRTNGVAGDSDALLPLNVGNHTKITVLNYTTVGEIISSGKVIEIENRGTIERINLSAMSFDTDYVDDLTGHAVGPQIFIDNYGKLTYTEIQLPINWASKYGTDSEGYYVGTTRIVSNPGAGTMTVNNCLNYHSDGSRDPERDDIEYVTLRTFIDKVNGSETEIVVQYTSDVNLFTVDTKVSIGEKLETLLKYYAGLIDAASTQGGVGRSVSEDLKIADPSAIQSMTIVGLNKELSSEDYTYIRNNMSSLRYLNLADASSVNLTMSTDALKDMDSLVEFIPSEYDVQWGSNVLTGTGVTEIWFPNSLESLVNSNAISSVKYIHTGNRFVTNSIAQYKYYFTPADDELVYSEYLSKGYAGKVFMDAQRYSAGNFDYFLRPDESNRTCEFVTVVNGQSPESEEIDIRAEKDVAMFFNLSTITIDELVYDIVSYDKYAFYKKRVSNTTEVEFGEKLQTIGDYAFTETKGLVDIRFAGETNVGAYAFHKAECVEIVFAKNAYLGDYAFAETTAKSIHAEKVTHIGTKVFTKMKSLLVAYLPSLVQCNNPFIDCELLIRIDVGVFQSGVTFESEGKGIGDLIFVHTDPEVNLSIYDYTLSSAISKLGRMIFLPKGYSKMYSSNFGQQVLLDEEETVEVVKEYYNPNRPLYKNELLIPNFYYSKNDNGTIDVLLCKETIITASSEVFNVRDENENSFSIETIGQYAYTHTEFNISGDVVFPETVKRVGAHAFSQMRSPTNANEGDGGEVSYKRYRRLMLSNVEYIGHCAFLQNLCYEVKGKYVSTLGDLAFGRMYNVVKIELPAWRYGEAQVHSWGYYFNACRNLQILLVGPMDQKVRDWALYNCTKLKLFVVDSTLAKPVLPASFFNNTNSPQQFYIGNDRGAFTSANAYSQILFADFKEQHLSENGVECDVSLPTSIYSLNANGVSVKLQKQFEVSVNGDTYLMPERLVSNGEKIEFLGEMIEAYSSVSNAENGLVVDSIGNSAFESINFGSNVTVYTGKYITELGTSTFKSTTMKGVNLENVVSVGSSCFNASSISDLTANKLKTVGESAFGNCKNLKSVNLPAVTQLNGWSFFLSGLETITLGPDLTSIEWGSFASCTSLKELILQPQNAITTDGDIFSRTTYTATDKASIIMFVSASARGGYIDKANEETSTWYGLKSDQIVEFERSFTDESTGIVYFYSLSDGGEAQITFLKTSDLSLLNGTFTFPSIAKERIVTTDEEGNEVVTENEYPIVGITDAVFSAFVDTATKEIVLPKQLKAFGNVLDALPTSLEALVIDENNAYFSTVNGVLYTGDGKTLLYYPRSKASASFTVGAAVQVIAENAFKDNASLETVTFAGVEGGIVIGGGAFENCTSLQTVVFERSLPATFVGRNIFANCHSDLKIIVPQGTLQAYQENVLFDERYVDVMQEAN